MLKIKELHKIELHVHIDCSLSFSAVQKMIPDISEGQYKAQFIAPSKCIDLAHYLESAQIAVNLLQTKENLAIAIDDLLHQQANDGVIYSELRFAPIEHTKQNLDIEEVITTALESIQKFAPKYDIKANLILCTLRHYSAEQSLKTAEMVKKYHNSGVVALDLASDEANYSIRQHIKAFDMVRELGIPTIAHAGEAAGSQSVLETIDLLKPVRIGHGVRAIEDPKVIAKIKEQNIHLEVCPSSNIQTNVYHTYSDHVINLLLNEGISFGINTDARAITNISLNKEYEKLVKYFGWQKEDFYLKNRQALDSAFISDELRSVLMNRLDVGYQ
jgi:adenosine deaminase